MINIPWSYLKQIHVTKGTLHFIEDSDNLYIFLLDGNFQVGSIINKNIDKESTNDFNINYRSAANTALGMKLEGATNNTKIGNVGDRLKTETSISSLSSGIMPTLSNNLRYDDMNVSNGGVARNTSITTAAYVTLHTYSGSGLLFGFTITFEGNLIGGDPFYIKFIVDSITVFEINTADLDVAIWALEDPNDDRFLGISMVGDKTFRFNVPENLSIKYNSNVTIQAKKVSGSSKQFRGGLVTLTKD